MTFICYQGSVTSISLLVILFILKFHAIGAVSELGMFSLKLFRRCFVQALTYVARQIAMLSPSPANSVKNTARSNTIDSTNRIDLLPLNRSFRVGLPVLMNYSTLNNDCVQLNYGTLDKAGLKLQSTLTLRETKWTYRIVFLARRVMQTALRKL